jgi:glycosyltransferase involved in cell wall biosynthesis
MKISLLIPAYNAAAYLPSLIEQARQQRRPFDAILVYDDGSTDATARVARDHGAQVMRGNENRGSGYARNQLLAAADSRFVHFHDADDPFIHPSFVERLLPHADAETAVICGWRAQNADQSAPDTYEYQPQKDWARFFINGHVHLNATIYPRQFLHHHGGFDPEMRMQQDLLLNAEMAGHGLAYYVVPEVLAAHQRRDVSTLGKTDATERHQWSIELCRRMARMPKPYHRLVARKALYHTRRLIELGALEQAREGITVAKALGLTEIEDRGRLVYLLSRFVGIEPALRYQLWRA